MAFVEAGDKWGLVRGKQQTFPAAAMKSVAGRKVAEPDALGKLRLVGDGAS
jgi:hypothetical protein